MIGLKWRCTHMWTEAAADQKERGSEEEAARGRVTVVLHTSEGVDRQGTWHVAEAERWQTVDDKAGCRAELIERRRRRKT